MSRPATLLMWCALLCTAGLLVSLGACGSGSSNRGLPPVASQKIRHVVVIFQENRSPDNLFHDPVLMARGADIASSGMNSSGQTIPLTPIPLAIDYDPLHGHDPFLSMYDGGKIDGADKIGIICAQGAMNCPPPNPQFAYVDPADVAPYFQLAEQYTFADRMFQTNQGPSFPAHQFIISGTSAPTPTSNLFAAENPTGTSDTGQGCASPPDTTVAMIDPTGSEAITQYPCFDHSTLVDLLDAKMVSWRYYAPFAGSIWTGPNAIQHLRFGPDWTNNVVLNSPQVLTDIATGQLAAVSWVIPTGQTSDHAITTDGSGPSWVASVVNAIGNSPYWSDTAIFITWDDWGGWYDHVAPPIINSYEYGFRVPMIVVSPYAKAAYVSHVTHDFGSILKFTEEVYGLGSLGYADALADDLSDCFDFSQTPLPFHAVSAQFDANHFLNDKRPPTDPDDD